MTSELDLTMLKLQNVVKLVEELSMSPEISDSSTISILQTIKSELSDLNNTVKATSEKPTSSHVECTTCLPRLRKDRSASNTSTDESIVDLSEEFPQWKYGMVESSPHCADTDDATDEPFLEPMSNDTGTPPSAEHASLKLFEETSTHLHDKSIDSIADEPSDQTAAGESTEGTESMSSNPSSCNNKYSFFLRENPKFHTTVSKTACSIYKEISPTCINDRVSGNPYNENFDQKHMSCPTLVSLAKTPGVPLALQKFASDDVFDDSAACQLRTTMHPETWFRDVVIKLKEHRIIGQDLSAVYTLYDKWAASLISLLVDPRLWSKIEQAGKLEQLEPTFLNYLESWRAQTPHITLIDLVREQRVARATSDNFDELPPPAKTSLCPIFSRVANNSATIIPIYDPRLQAVLLRQAVHYDFELKLALEQGVPVDNSYMHKAFFLLHVDDFPQFDNKLRSTLCQHCVNGRNVVAMV